MSKVLISTSNNVLCATKERESVCAILFTYADAFFSSVWPYYYTKFKIKFIEVNSIIGYLIVIFAFAAYFLSGILNSVEISNAKIRKNEIVE